MTETLLRNVFDKERMTGHRSVIVRPFPRTPCYPARENGGARLIDPVAHWLLTFNSLRCQMKT